MTKALVLVVILSIAGLLRAQETHPGQMNEEASPQMVTVTGTVVDSTGAAILNASVSVTPAGPDAKGSAARAGTDASGAFLVHSSASGPLRLTVTAPGFAELSIDLSISPGETKDLGSLALAVAAASSSVQVTPTRNEIATEQIKEEESQRLFGVVPNFLVTYRESAVPLTVKQKFALTSKLTFDPSAFVITGVIAGIQQADDAYPGYGQGAQGFGKRYGASYADFAIANVLSSAVLPSLLKQDPRYFVKSEGTVRSRVLYALANSVVRRGDNGRWQPDYSSILGDIGAGAISNLYYPSADRQGAALTFENAGIGIAAGAAANLLQEFVLRKITPKAAKKNTGAP